MWIFLSLKEGPKYVSGLQESIERFSKGTIRAEDQSLYRTLRKYYHLTPLGESLLHSFVERNRCI